MLANSDKKILKFNKEGLIPVVTQDFISKDILMVAYMNKEALEKTIESGYTHYWSRSRKKLWKKGEESGNTQKIVDVFVDCDFDALLLLVEQKGNACHTGNRSCFYTNLDFKKIQKIF